MINLRSIIIKEVENCSMNLKYLAQRAAKRILRRFINLEKTISFIASAEYYAELQELLKLSMPEGLCLIHTGRKYDGGYILKMDVEGAEWGFLKSVRSGTLSQFGQITFELHNVTGNDNPELVLEVLRKINRTHQLVHIHANNNGDYVSCGGKKFCQFLEVLYILRENYTFVADYNPALPLDIDYPNASSLPEIELGRWNEHTDIGRKFTVHVRTI